MKIFIIIFLLLNSGFAETLLIDDFNDRVNGGNPNALLTNLHCWGDGLSYEYVSNNCFGNSGYSIKIHHSGSNWAWFAFEFRNVVQLSQYKSISFWIKGSNGGERFKLDFKDQADNEPSFRPFIENYITNGITTNWKKIVIPTYALRKDTGKTNIKYLVFDFSGGIAAETFYIDDIVFHSKIAPCYVDNFDDGVEPNAWGNNQWAWINGGSGASYNYTYDNSNKVGDTGYSLKIDWNPGSSPYPSDSVTGSEILPRNWGGGSSGEDLSICDKISFYALAGNNGEGRRVCLALYADPGGEQEIVTANNLFTLSSGWQKITKNLSTDFPGLTLQNICGVQWWLIRNGICTNTNNFSFYIDNVVFEDTTPPTSPSSFKANNINVSDGFIFNKITNKLIATASSYNDDRSMESVYFEYSTNSSVWYRIGTDWDTTDVSYSNLWIINNLNDGALYSIKVVSQDIAGNKSELQFNNCKIGNINIITNKTYSGGILRGTTNVTVMSFTINELFSHYIKEIKFRNLGTASNSVDITNVRLHYDVNKNNSYDSFTDITISTGYWDTGENCFKFTNLSVPSKTNLIITIDVKTNANIGRTFKGAIFANDVKCIYNRSNDSSISNSAELIILGAQVYVSKIDINPTPYKIKVGQTNKEILAFKYFDTTGNTLKILAISNLGTMSSITDISVIKIWDDTGTTSGKFDGGEKFIGYLNYDNLRNKWTNNNLVISNSKNILITLNPSATLRAGKTFKACIANTNDIENSAGIHSHNTITNSGVLTAISEFNITNYTGKKEFYTGESILIKLKVDNTETVSTVTLFYKPVGENNYIKGEMVLRDRFYIYVIQPEFKEGIIEYYFKAINIYNEEKLLPLDAPKNYYTIRVIKPDKFELKVYNTILDYTKGEKSIQLEFKLGYEGEVEINLFNLKGERVKSILKSRYLPGLYRVDFEPLDLEPGVYVIYLKGPYNTKLKKKIAVIK